MTKSRISTNISGTPMWSWPYSPRRTGASCTCSSNSGGQRCFPDSHLELLISPNVKPIQQTSIRCELCGAPSTGVSCRAVMVRLFFYRKTRRPSPIKSGLFISSILTRFAKSTPNCLPFLKSLLFLSTRMYGRGIFVVINGQAKWLFSTLGYFENL